jgi:copper chaperone NosL
MASAATKLPGFVKRAQHALARAEQEDSAAPDHSHATDTAHARIPFVRRDTSRDRLVVLALGAVATGLFWGSFFLPYWSYHLVAPQYPSGLNLYVSLSGVTGDLREIDILNHYIGMKGLAEGAVLERAIGGYLVAGLGLTVLLGVLATGRRVGWLGIVPALGMPLGFLADLAYWMHRFGHELDPTAPINFDEFDPVLLGNGMVGQFHTAAWPSWGFAMVLGSVVMAAVAARYRAKRVCATCALRDTCAGTCPRVTVLPERS